VVHSDSVAEEGSSGSKKKRSFRWNILLFAEHTPRHHPAVLLLMPRPGVSQNTLLPKKNKLVLQAKITFLGVPALLTHALPFWVVTLTDTLSIQRGCLPALIIYYSGISVLV